MLANIDSRDFLFPVLFDCLAPALDLSVALRIVRTGSHVAHSPKPNELHEVFGDELATVVGDDPWLGQGTFTRFL